jgi:hypothetical protein
MNEEAIFKEAVAKNYTKFLIDIKIQIQRALRLSRVKDYTHIHAHTLGAYVDPL